MHNILLEIIEKKRTDLAEQKVKTPLADLQKHIKEKTGESNFYAAMTKRTTIALIAEIKLASPTIPNLGSETEIFQRAAIYETAGADAISFITEKHYFKGDPGYIHKLKSTVSIPVLQKDFVIDHYQIYEAASIGSDALLLIARLVDGETLQSFVTCAQSLGIEPVVEINNKEDLDKAVQTTTRIIAVNARDLSTFSIDIKNACKLLEQIPDTYTKLGFSGIKTNQEVMQYKAAGANGVLVGTNLMRANNISEYMQQLRTL
jgi:indole-3-glycerol phosphate synthase